MNSKIAECLGVLYQIPDFWHTSSPDTKPHTIARHKTVCTGCRGPSCPEKSSFRKKTMESLSALHKYPMSHSLFTDSPPLMGILSDLGFFQRATSVESSETSKILLHLLINKIRLCGVEVNKNRIKLKIEKKFKKMTRISVLT